ncbi:MAG: pilus assembly PilX N-terminal domain-containing protein [Desulfobulbaceae bacterium]|nr:pilus assembly PilX N-terminal domain-containing protein [Desulfobulbaceae bacterium]
MIPFVNKIPPGLRNNEKGFVLVTSLMILMVLMVIGVVTTSTTSTDVKIAGNDKRYKQNFYNTEGATMAVAQRIENATADDLKVENAFPSGLKKEANVDRDDVTTWTESSDDPNDPDFLYPSDKVRYLALDNGVSKGGSLDMTNPSRIHSFDIYGCAEKVTIKIGYKKRY